MTLTRRQFTRTATIACAATWPLAGALAQQAPAWPRGPVRFVVPFAPGGGADVAARMMAEQLRNQWGGNTVLIDNKAGANTIIATEAVLNAPRDGSTFLATISLTTQLPYLMQKVPFNPMTDLVPVGAISVEQLVLVANAASQVKTLPDLLKAAKANPSKFAFGSYGIGSNSHLVMIELAKASGVDIIHAPYRGAAPAVQAVLAGEVGFALSNLGTVKQHLATGKLVALAVTGESRYRFIPQVPTLLELGFKGFEVPAWIGVFAANGVPQPIIQKLGADMRSALKNPDLIAKFNEFGQEAGQLSVEAFQALVNLDNENASRMIRAAGVRLE